SDNTVIAIILTGAGDKAFMAGADIKEFPDRDIKQAEGESTHEVFSRITSIPKPTIAMLNGYTFGGGLELALICDIRIAEEHALLGLPEVNLGLLPGAGGTQRLPHLVGAAIAKEMMYTGRQVKVEEALKIGLVNNVVPKGEGMQVAGKLANNIAQKSLQSLSRIKRLINLSDEASLQDGLQEEEKMF